jgi:hypothetical protein
MKTDDIAYEDDDASLRYKILLALESSHSRRPRKLLPAQDVNVKMIHALAALHSVVDHASESRVELLLLGHELSGVHEMTQNSLVFLRRLGETRQTGANLWNDQKVSLCLRVDVAESQRQVVLVNDGGGDFLGDDFIKDGALFAISHTVQVRLLRRQHLVVRSGHCSMLIARGLLKLSSGTSGSKLRAALECGGVRPSSKREVFDAKSACSSRGDARERS